MKANGWIFIAVLFILLMEASTLFAAGAGEILAVRKNVYLEREGAKNRAEAKTPLMEEDAVATDKSSRAKLYFSDDSILNLGELSRVEVAEYLAQSGTKRTKTIYNLLEGSLKVVVGNSDLEIHTPTAVAAARGTKFYLKIRDCEKKGQKSSDKACKESCIFVLDGEVSYRNRKKDVEGRVLVGKGQTSCVPIEEPPTNAGPYNLSETEELLKSTSVLGEFPEEKINFLLPEEIAGNSLEDLEETLNDEQDGNLPDIDQEPKEGLTPVTVIIQYP